MGHFSFRDGCRKGDWETFDGKLNGIAILCMMANLWTLRRRLG